MGSRKKFSSERLQEKRTASDKVWMIKHNPPLGFSLVVQL
jgi:hypothetical protein